MSDFDPDAFLSGKKGDKPRLLDRRNKQPIAVPVEPVEGFDPDAFLAQRAQTDAVFADAKKEIDKREALARAPRRGTFTPVNPPHEFDLSEPYSPKISSTRAATLGLAQGGSFGFMPEIGAAYSAATSDRTRLPPGMRFSPDDTPQERAIKEEVALRQIIQAEAGGDPLAYKPMRKRLEREVAQAREDRPAEYLTSEMLGSVATSFAPGGGSYVLSRGIKPGTAIAAQTGYGALQGAGDSEAELLDGEVGPFLYDAVKGATLNTAAGALGYKTGKNAPTLLRASGNKLERIGVDRGRRHILSGADSLSKRELSDEAVRRALDEKAIPMLGTVEKTHQNLTDLAEGAGKTYGELVETLEKNGVEGPRAREFVSAIIRRRAELRPTETNDAVLAVYDEAADTILDRAGLKPKAAGGHGHHGAPKPAGPELVDQFGRPAPKAPPQTKDRRLGLTQAEGIKRSLQRDANFGRYENTPVADAKQEISAMLKEANERAIEEAAAQRGGYVAELAEDFKPVKRRTGELIEARDASRRGQQKFQGRQNSSTPSAVDTAIALATENPVMLAGSAARNFSKNRLPAFAARSYYGTGRTLKRAGVAASRVDDAKRAAVGGGLGGALERFIAADAEYPQETEKERRMRLLLEALRGE